jgi:hypothetical protein
VESKGAARQAGTTFFAVRVVNDLTLFSRSFFSGSFLDIQVYIDDVVITTRKEESLIDDL